MLGFFLGYFGGGLQVCLGLLFLEHGMLEALASRRWHCQCPALLDVAEQDAQDAPFERVDSVDKRAVPLKHTMTHKHGVTSDESVSNRAYVALQIASGVAVCSRLLMHFGKLRRKRNA